ncbi:ROK family protein [Psychromicrobium xiongbiense]|uniref:ROK family protein n=1 Tax=Psychromicrobium xiongbiense TaxID=3051184 RepID=UPI002557938F|nr:ROK family protein [Psychromicrobium sp. YIM S02556]
MRLHTLVRSGGRSCHCGSRGCLETEVTQSRLFDLVGVVSGDSVHLEEALRTHDGAAVAREIQRQLSYLEIALRNAVNVFNPESIVLDGFLGVLEALAPGELEAALKATAMDGPGLEVAVHRAALGADLMMIGAAELAFSGFLADPVGAWRA